MNDTFSGSDEGETGGGGGARNSKIVADSEGDDRPVVRKERFTLQDDAYDRQKKPRKSVLKRTPVNSASPVSNAYAPPSSPSESSTGSVERQQQQGQPCCTIL